MNSRIGAWRIVSPWLLAAAAALAPAAAQQEPEALERLRRDQEEILRKAERLRGMMQRLQQRYEREDKPDQVKLLLEGIAHLERSGLLREVAGIRDDIAANAYAEALRKQQEVVTDLERLIDILLERKSMASLDADLAKVAEQARTARELEERQRELRERTAAAMQTPPSPGEQRLLDALQQLRDAERREADANARQAGTRRPFLEDALQRVRELLRDQARLEQGLADEAAGRRSEARAREFDLGELAERTRELQAELRDQQRQLDLGAAAADLQQQAGGSDQAAVERARDALEARLQQAPRRGGTSEGKARDPEWTALKDALRSAGNGATEAERAQLQQLGSKGAEVGAARAAEAARRNAETADKLQQGAGRLAERMRAATAGATPATPSPADALADAQRELAAAATSAAAGDLSAAQRQTEQALANLDRARARQQEQNPDADLSAARMAAAARAASQELRNAPSGEAAEQQAGDLLQAAESALRDVGEPSPGQPSPGQPSSGQQPGGQGQPDQPQADSPQSGQRPAGQPQTGQPQGGPSERRERAAARSRAALQQAEQTLQQALQQASANSTPDMAQAAARQQELRQQADAARQQLTQAQRDGAITAPQRDKAEASLQQAIERMQAAGERLQEGQQASAAAEQQAAAEELQQAMAALDRNRPADAAQRDRVQQEAARQQKLQEDIVRLAEQLRERKEQAAERKVAQAADAAERARRAMQQGEMEEAIDQQEEARQKLDEAAKELEQEEDRYQDLRQEELLFRMADELTTFLERQRPITAQTAEAAKSATADGLSRAMRSKVNQLGEEEQDLAGKLATLVQALTEEGNLVYQAVLKANIDDLREVARRLAGRRPDVGAFTTMLQGDVERRTQDLLAALERERQRRQQERNEQQQQQQQQDRGRNRFNQQRKKLVSLIAELEMLKQLGVDTRKATDDLRTLVEARGDMNISDAETALIERLAHRHGEITKLFQQIKAGVEETMQQMQQQEGQEPEGGRGR